MRLFLATLGLLCLLQNAQAPAAEPKTPTVPALLSEWALYKGNSAYRKGAYAEALKSYQEAEKKESKDPAPPFNQGNALYRMEQFPEAVSRYQTAAEKPASQKESASTHYNLGNAYFKQGNYLQAAENYRRSLILNPTDPEAQHNLSLALKMLQEKKQPQKKQDSDGSSGSSQKDSPAAQSPRPLMNREDAERILKALEEKAKESFRPRIPRSLGTPDRKNSEVDW
ncbi:MAG: tetratricopeptide repeat protein [Elusimicrobia bacterium]|nr:tetratricopeptide repeat protein [Elusimicrobiota bacterium]